MKLAMNTIIFILIIIFIQCNKGENPISEQIGDKIQINVNLRIANVSDKPGGVVSCWLMDSDIERPRKNSFTDAMKDMGVKFIRFPYGHLADNYLWDADGDWGNTLTPKVATLSQVPGNWDWAVDQSSGEFIKDMDFDEYISICNEVGAEPMVVVNILSYKYENGLTYEQLKESAVEWVRYANITKKYNVKRWALVNEVDHHPKFITQEEYKALYTDFANAMKIVDPDIMVGPGLLGNWHASMFKYDPENIDFSCVHNYLYKYDWRNQDYEGWKNTTDNLVGNVEKCQNAVTNSTIPDIEIHVTEMNSRPWSDKSDNDDLFRALAYAEMMLNASSFKNVKATYAWNTHGPWGGENENATYNILDLDNNREPRGDIIKIINENLLDYFVSVPRVNGYIRTYASVDEANKNLTVFLINKNDQPEKVNIDLSGFKDVTDYFIQTYSGNGPYDKSPTLSEINQIEMKNKKLSTELSPVSLTIIHLK